MSRIGIAIGLVVGRPVGSAVRFSDVTTRLATTAISSGPCKGGQA